MNDEKELDAALASIEDSNIMDILNDLEDVEDDKFQELREDARVALIKLQKYCSGEIPDEDEEEVDDEDGDDYEEGDF